MLVISEFLQKLGYGEYESIVELNKRAVIKYDTHIEFNEIWNQWQGILEYISCVEYARESLLLPSKKEVIVSARYDSASLIFFAQASQDNIAVWLNDQFELRLAGSNIALNKDKFQNKLIAANGEFESYFNEYRIFLKELNNFRMEWIHRLSGGADVFADASPSETNSNMQICVPIDPSINLFKNDYVKYLEKINDCKDKNEGKWLYTIDEFANKFANNTRDSTLKLLKISLGIITS
ncbi:hypothetical protein [Paenibacillus xylanexedens]|uniref:hypothetical protein n=1 Tax=Paenibacillus xylanexedens TaxID=528191 RepID=UPI003B015C72